MYQELTYQQIIVGVFLNNYSKNIGKCSQYLTSSPEFFFKENQEKV
jgi:hypothetical protein